MFLAWLKKRRAERALVERDAIILLSHYGDKAFDIARLRERAVRHTDKLEGGRSSEHWAKVRDAISKKTGQGHVDTATRYLEDR